MKSSRNICSIVGIVSLLIYIILTVVGTNNYLLAMRVFFAGVAAVAYSIKMGIELANDESIGYSIFLVAICILDVVISSIQMVS